MRITTFIGVEGLSAIRTSRELTPQAPRTARRPQHCWALCTPPTASACLAPLVHCGRPRTPCQAAGGLFFKAVVCSLARPAPRTSGQLGPHLVSPTPDPHLTPEPRKPSPAPDKKCKHMALPASVKKKKTGKKQARSPARPSGLWGCGPGLLTGRATAEALLLCAGLDPRGPLGRGQAGEMQAGLSGWFQLPALPMQHLF